MEHFDDTTVRALLDPAEMADALEQVFGEWGRGDAASTVRVRAAANGAMASAMAAVIPSMGVSGGKIYATKDGRFTFHVVLFDLEGHLVATLDGGSITAVRTPALCAVAIRRLAAHRITSAALIGTGIEARPHLDMLARELPGVPIRLWGRDSSKSAALVKVATIEGMDVSTAPTADEAVDGAQVVIAVTSANSPVFEASSIADDALVCGVGATKPERCELPPELMGRAAAIVTDSVEGSPLECGDLIRAAEQGHFEWSQLLGLADVLAGSIDVERAGGTGPVVFETQGVALQDVAAAALVLRQHRARSTEAMSINNRKHSPRK